MKNKQKYVYTEDIERNFHSIEETQSSLVEKIDIILL